MLTAKPTPAQGPDPAELSLHDELLGQPRNPGEPAGADVLVALDLRTCTDGLDTDLPRTPPETPELPLHKLIRPGFGYAGHERKREALQGNAIPVLPTRLDLANQAVKPDPVGRRLEIAIDLCRGQGYGFRELDTHR